MHATEIGIIATASAAAATVIGRVIWARVERAKAMQVAEAQERKADVTLDVRRIDDTAQIRQQLWERVEKLEARVADLGDQLQRERQKYVELLQEYAQLQVAYEQTRRDQEAAQEQVKQLKEELLRYYAERH